MVKTQMIKGSKRKKVAIFAILFFVILIIIPIPGSYDKLAPIRLGIEVYDLNNDPVMEASISLKTGGWAVSSPYNDGEIIGRTDADGKFSKLTAIYWASSVEWIFWGSPHLKIRLFFNADLYRECYIDFSFPRDQEHFDDIVVFLDQVQLRDGARARPCATAITPPTS